MCVLVVGKKRLYQRDVVEKQLHSVLPSCTTLVQGQTAPSLCRLMLRWCSKQVHASRLAVAERTGRCSGGVLVAWHGVSKRRASWWREGQLATRDGTATFPLLSHALEITQPNNIGKDVSIDGILHTLSRTYLVFINIPLAEARDFRCRAQTVDDPQDRSFPCWHTAIRIEIL